MKLPLRAVLTTAFMSLALAACATDKPSALNPDPVHGGPCKNGDQGCTPCRGADGATWTCPDDYLCQPEGCLIDESQIGPDRVNGNLGAKRGAAPAWCDQVQVQRGGACPSHRGELAPKGKGLLCVCAEKS